MAVPTSSTSTVSDACEMTWRSLLKTGKSWASPEGLGLAPACPQALDPP